jgi:alpha-beta hydrolase superfamily lysophospholipase
LQADGYHVINVDLPGRPSNPIAPNLVSVDVYRDTVLKAISGETRPVVLVGHSFGGIPLSTVGEATPAKVKTLVYWLPICRRTANRCCRLPRKTATARPVQRSSSARTWA